MSRYLKLARRAAAQEEHHKSNEKPKQKEAPAPQPANYVRASASDSSELEEKPGPPVPNRDKSDRSDKSPDYLAVLEVIQKPPCWLRDSYLAGYRRGTITLFALSGGVAAALGRSPYEWTKRLMPLVKQALESGVPTYDPAPGSNSSYKNGAEAKR